MLKQKFDFKRYLIGALIGTIYATLSLIASENFIHSVVIKLLVAIIMILTAYGINSIEEFIKPFLIFWLATLVLGGTLFAMNITKNIIYEIYGVIVSSLLLLMIWKAYKNNILNQNMKCNIEIKIDDLKFKSKVFIDTGNNLHDNISGEPVILISKERLEKVLPKDLIDILEAKTLSISKKYEGRIRMIQYQVINDNAGVLIGIRADNIEIRYNNANIRSSNVIMALANNKFENCDGLIGLNILEEGYTWK